MSDDGIRPPGGTTEPNGNARLDATRVPHPIIIRTTARTALGIRLDAAAGPHR
jgi:hypothetical protein